MSLSRILGLLWVLAVSFYIRQWQSTGHLTTTWVVLVLGIAVVVAAILEWLGVLNFSLGAPRHRGGSAPQDPTV